MTDNEKDRIVDSANQNDDAIVGNSRPRELSDFIGQKQVRDNLSIFIGAAQSRAEPMDHVLLHGPPGLGKTTLAEIISRELKVGFKATSGPVVAKAGDLAAILTNLQTNDVLFIDEIHRLSPIVEEILYPAVEDYKLDLVIGEGPAARSVRIDLNPFTLIGATTRAGLITTPLRDRFGILFHLQYYETEDLQKIITRAANLVSVNMTEDGAREIARRSRGTPRIAGRLFRRVRDFATVSKLKSIDKKAADEALNRLDVDTKGLDALDRRYLGIIAKNYKGGRVGIETLSAALSEERDTIEEVVEPYLIQEGLLMRTPRGRALAEGAYQHLGLQVPKNLSQFELITGEEGYVS
ncbi:MAG: Holliday junction branch migration DNA helicase RuvB [Rhodospirillaceae bacterium]|nr:Holliday junction branch migration DNA helicase RuvB [Rhodospirillaceae bacterium]